MNLKKSIKIEDIINLIHPLEVRGDRTLELTGISDLFHVKEKNVTYLGNNRYIDFISGLNNVAIITSAELVPQIDNLSNGNVLLIVDNPDFSFNGILKHFFPENEPIDFNHTPNYTVGQNFKIGDSSIIASNCFIGNNVSIGDHTRIFPNTYIGNDVVIGEGCLIFPNVTIYHKTIIGNNVSIKSGSVIGLDGFLFYKKERMYCAGNVIIEDDVSVGSCVCIDRGRTSSTIVGKGTILDNLIQIGHGVKIGHDCIIGAGVAIGGEVKIGNNTLIRPTCRN